MTHFRAGLLAAVTATLLFSLTDAEAQSGEGLRVYSQDILEYIYPKEYKHPEKESDSVQLIGVRNGRFAAQVVLVTGAPIKGLKGQASDLSGPGKIPASNVVLRYGVPSGQPKKRGQVGFFDALEDEPEAEIKYADKDGQIIQPVWIKVHVPKDAKPGDYTGKVTFSSDAGPASVNVKLKLFDFALPSTDKYHGHMDVVESPESVAMAYGVEMWSPEHMKLLDRTLSILGEMGQKTIYISAIRRTHFGNEHAMVRWVKNDKGELEPNFDVVEKYLNVAAKHLGKIPGVVFLCWEPIESMGHAGGTGTAARTTDKPVQYTLLDPKKNKLKKRTGPAWGTPESKAFWKKFTDGVQPMLEKHGLQDSMLFGLIGDSRPTNTAMDDVCNAVPKEKAKWAVHSHHYCANWQGYDIGMGIALWGIHLNICDPEQGHGFGWRAKRWLAYYPREFHMGSAAPEHRYKMEMWMNAFSLFEMKHKKTSRYACGLGRIGGDFWRVVKDGRGRIVGTLAGYYPESYWGQLNLNYCIASILGKGKKGAVPTVRSEAFREGNQDVEVRVFVEKAVEIPEHRAKVGDEIAGRARKLLDDRIRMCNYYGGTRKDHKSGKIAKVKLDWQTKNEELYKLAAEIGAKLGTNFIEGRGPDPVVPKKK